MVDYTEPICQTIDSSLASMLTFDTSGIELYVTENNPKTLNSLIRRLKAYMCVAGRKTRNHATTKADVFLAEIASQLTVIVAHNMNCPQYIRSLKPLIV